MTAGQIAEAHGGDVWYFDYDHLDLASTLTLGAGEWGQYQANNVTVGDTIVATGADGYYWTSITLRHLAAYTTAHVHYEGSGLTLQFTLDGGTTWTNLPEDGVITLGTHVDFDLRASFGANSGGHLDSLTVYILKTETLRSNTTGRVLTFDGNIIANGSMIVPASVNIAPANTTATLPQPTPILTGFDNADGWTLTNATIVDGVLVCPEDWQWSSNATAKNTVDFRGRALSVRIIPPPDTPSDAYINIIDTPGNIVALDIYHNQFQGGFYRASDNTWYSYPVAVPFDAVADAWCRVRESNGTIYWENSPDGVNWNTQGTAPAWFDMSNVKLVVGSGDDDNNSRTAKFQDARFGPVAPAPTGSVDNLIGSIEMWVVNQNNFVYSGPSSSLYVDGVVANSLPADGRAHHIVRVLDTAANTAFSIGSNLTISHLAVYRKIMNAGDVTDLYTAQTGGGKVSIADDGAIGVTEYSPAVDIYAYSWSVVQGGNK